MQSTKRRSAVQQGITSSACRWLFRNPVSRLHRLFGSKDKGSLAVLRLQELRVQFFPNSFNSSSQEEGSYSACRISVSSGVRRSSFSYKTQDSDQLSSNVDQAAIKKNHQRWIMKRMLGLASFAATEATNGMLGESRSCRQQMPGSSPKTSQISQSCAPVPTLPHHRAQPSTAANNSIGVWLATRGISATGKVAGGNFDNRKGCRRKMWRRGLQGEEVSSRKIKKEEAKKGPAARQRIPAAVNRKFRGIKF